MLKIKNHKSFVTLKQKKNQKNLIQLYKSITSVIDYKCFIIFPIISSLI